MRKYKCMGILFLLLILVSGLIPKYVNAAPCAASEHRYRMRIIREADADNDGECEYQCEYCGDTYTEVIPRTGHHYGDFQIETAANCAAQGLQYRECRDCGKREYEVIPFSTEHDFGDWSIIRQPGCGEAGIRQRVCRICKQSQEEEISSDQSHNYEQITTPATCTEEGEVINRCTNCGDTVIVESLPALGHDYGEEFIKAEPTEDAEGLACRICAHDETHVLERKLPRLEKMETEQPKTEQVTETEAPETEPETAPPPEQKRGITPIEAAVAGVNTATFGIYFFLIRSDLAVLLWAKRNRRLMYERGEWK